MKLPLRQKPSIRRLSEQTDEEKMYLLKLEAHQILGGKWAYFRKIKNAGRDSGLFREKSLFEEMKATQSALKFTAKNTLRQYNLAYLNCLKEIRNFAVTDEEFPELPDENDSNAVRAMIPRQDAVIIGWTPIKFLLPARQIREKGTASQRHTEGLLAKLFFKVVGFYSVPENWDVRKLSFYLHKITASSSYQEVAEKLEPLKKDLYAFSEEFEPFKFGQANLSRDFTSDSDAFDDAMEVDSFKSQIRTLYWYGYIYRALESFMLRYYLTLLASTASVHAIRYLSNIFEPALNVALDMSILFEGSFETDKSRKRFRKPFINFQEEKKKEGLSKTIKTRQGLFEVYNHNFRLLKRFGASFSVIGESDRTSFWWQFAEKNILGKDRTDLETELTFTPYHQLGKTFADLGRQNESLAEQMVRFEEELKDLKVEMEGLKRERATLDKTYREEKPEEISQRLKQRKSTAESERAHLEKGLKDQKAAADEFLKQLQQLAEERDRLMAEEEQLKTKENEWNTTVKKLQKEEAAARKKLAGLEGYQESKPNSGSPKAGEENRKLAVLKADMEQITEKLTEAENRLTGIRDRLADVDRKRKEEIAPGFETAQDQQTKGLHEKEVLERSLLVVRKQLKQIGEEQAALEERDSRYAESKKKLEAAAKNAEKSGEKTTKALQDIKGRIEQNKQEILQLKEKQQAVLEETKRKLQDLISPESRSMVLAFILATLIICSGGRKKAWEKVLERFKQRMIADQELARERVDEIKKEAQKKLREMHKKASKLKRLKQEAAATAFEAEITEYQKGIDAKCRRIIKNAREEEKLQRQRITSLFQNVSRQKKRSDAADARHLFDLIVKLEEGQQFKQVFIKILIGSIAKHYEKKLEPLYRELFSVLNPSLLNRVALVQALEKSGGDGGIKLKLSEQEQNALDTIIQGARNQIRQQKKDLFECQVAIQTTNTPLETLLNIGMNNESLRLILQSRFISPAKPRGERIDNALAERILHLNRIMHPVPEYHLLTEGKENSNDPLQQVNISLLRKLIAASA